MNVSIHFDVIAVSAGEPFIIDEITARPELITGSGEDPNGTIWSWGAGVTATWMRNQEPVFAPIVPKANPKLDSSTVGGWGR